MMKETFVQKEEVLLMLTDLCNELEVLEKAVESSFSNSRKKSLNEQSSRLSIVDNRIAILESQLEAFQLSRKEDNKYRNNQALQLELGY